MITCLRCDNETRTTELVTAQGSVMIAGPGGSEPQPVQAHICVACGYIQLYGPQPISLEVQETIQEPLAEPLLTPAAAASSLSA